MADLVAEVLQSVRYLIAGRYSLQDAAQSSRDSIAELVSGPEERGFDAVIFTSKAQFQRLFEVAAAIGRVKTLTGLIGDLYDTSVLSSSYHSAVISHKCPA